MHVPMWGWFTIIALMSNGITGLFQKQSTNFISAESTLILLIVVFLLLEPFVYPGSAIFHYAWWNLGWGLLSGLLSALGCWALFAALRSGGKASVVSPLAALYPLIVILVGPFFLHESITPSQGAGIVCAIFAGLFFSIESEGETAK